METVGLGFCYEDLPVGRRFRTIGRTVTETDITNFVSATGMLEVLFINSDFREKESNITGFAFLEMELKVLGPTLAGDTIHCEVEVTEARRSKSRPNRGLVRTRNKVFNQNGKQVLEYTPLRMIKARTTDKEPGEE